MSAETKPIAPEAFSSAIQELTDDNIVALRTQLQLSVSKLTETNDMLALEIETIGDLTTEEAIADVALYKETIAENQEVLLSQQERLAMLESEFKRRGI